MEFGYSRMWHEMYLKDLISIIEKHWPLFQKHLAIEKGRFIQALEYIAENRPDAHAKSVTEDELLNLRMCFDRLEKSLRMVE